jgi:Flp pilus assembly pilin Flp
MLALLPYLRAFLATRSDERGEVSLEYALVGGLMAVAIIAGIVGLTGALAGWFTGIGNAITNAVPAP